MPPQYSSISWRAVMPAGASLTPAARALPDDVPHPIKGLDVVAQGRSAEEPDLGREGRPLARQPSLAFDAFEHRRFLAADISTGAAAEMDPRMPGQARRLDCGNLAVEDGAALRVFVPQIEIDLGRLDHPGGDQHAFDETMRVGFQKMAVLEGAWLAFVAIDRQ